VRPAIRPRAALAITFVVAGLAPAGCAARSNIDVPATAQAAACAPLRVTSVTPDFGFGNLFQNYGDQNLLGLHWTGGDGTWSARLPDGQTLWNMGDTFIGLVHPPDAAHPAWWRQPPQTPGSQSWFIRNSGLIQLSPAQGGLITSTLYRISPGGSVWSWLAEPGPRLRYGPGAAIAEPAAPGSSRQVLRLFNVVISDRNRSRYPFGFDVGSVVVTYDLTDFSRPRSIVSLPAGPGRDPAHQVFFGSGVLTADGFTYVFGGTANDTQMSAYLARYRTGAGGDPSAWQYWDGGGWASDIDVAAPILPYRVGRTGVSPGYSVVRQGSTYVLFTVAGQHGSDIGPIVSYWACAPTGPWHGPYAVYQPPQTAGGGVTGNMLAYNIHVHPEWTTGTGLLLSYDINDALPSATAAVIEADVNLYRPQFVRVKLRPVRRKAPHARS